MFKTILTFCMLGSFAHAADVAGFSSGNDFKATPLEGQVVVTCEGFNGGGSASFTCRDVVLDPVSYDYFKGPRDARATKVELTNKRDDNSVRTKSDDYDGARGRSRGSVNLWISTLFQKPLLMAGKNRIHYKVTGDNTSAAPFAEGDIVVTVTRNKARSCPTTHYNSADVNDCTSQYSVCQRYFEQFNYCR
ncbi:MAG: hypothetical protein J7501_07100 [Bdellovibrio sp.]|nr:hypothetical protein [Bdellovibrio sp.]